MSPQRRIIAPARVTKPEPPLRLLPSEVEHDYVAALGAAVQEVCNGRLDRLAFLIEGLGLDPEDLASDHARKVVQVIRDLYSTGVFADWSIVRHELVRRLGPDDDRRFWERYLVDKMTNGAFVSALPHYAQVIRQAAQDRRRHAALSAELRALETGQ